jgi:hypothetical protein
MAGKNFWTDLGPLIEKAKRELRCEELQQVSSEINLRLITSCLNQVQAYIIDRYEENEPAEEQLSIRLQAIKQRCFQEAIQEAKDCAKKPLEEFIPQIENLKLLLLKGIFDEDKICEFLDVILDRLRALRHSKPQLAPELVEARKENALLHQQISFLKEELEYVKAQQQTFNPLKINIAKQAEVIIAESLSKKVSSFDETIMEKPQRADSEPNTSKQSGLIKPSKKTDASNKGDIKVFAMKKSLGGNDYAGRRDSFTTTIKTEPAVGCTEIPISFPPTPAPELAKENCELREQLNSYKTQLFQLREKFRDVVEEKDHLIKIMNIENNNTIEALNKRLEEIKETHKLEKESLIRRLEDETEKYKNRFKDLDSSWVQRNQVQNLENESRYGEMKNSLQFEIESQHRDLKAALDRIKDAEDLRRLEGMRYESRIQELKAEIRKYEAKVEILKKKVRDSQVFDDYGSPPRKEHMNSPHLMNRFPETSSKESSRKHKELGSFDSYIAMDTPDQKLHPSSSKADILMSPTQNKNFGSMSNSLLKSDLGRVKFINLRDNNSTGMELCQDAGSASKNNSTLKGDPTYMFKKAGLQIEDLDGSINRDMGFSKTRINPRASRENILSSDIHKYYPDNSKGAKQVRASNARFDIDSLFVEKNSDSYSLNLSKKYDYPVASSVSKPLDYFLKKKQSLQGKL